MSKEKPVVESTGWNTPGWLFKFLDEKYHFTLDAAASERNAKCKRYFTKEDDSFEQKWTGNVFLNPPYGDKLGPSTEEWIELAYRQAKHANLVCMLIPLKADTNFYHDRIRLGKLVSEERFTDPRGKEGIYQRRLTDDNMLVETYEFRQRIAFEDDEGNAGSTGWFSSVAVVYRRLK